MIQCVVALSVLQCIGVSIVNVVVPMKMHLHSSNYITSHGKRDNSAQMYT